MIQYASLVPNCSIFAEMVKLDETFYLTGSRFFTVVRDSFTDWDFFVQDSETIRYWLASRDFRLVADDDSYDETTVRRPVDTGSPHIDVQICANAEEKIRTQLAIASAGVGRYLKDKELSHRVWDMGRTLHLLMKDTPKEDASTVQEGVQGLE